MTIPAPPTFITRPRANRRTRRRWRRLLDASLLVAAAKAMDGKRTADAADRSRDSRTNVEEDTDGSKVKPEGPPILDLFAEDHEPGGYYNPLPANMPAEAAEAQNVLFGDSGGSAGGSSSSSGPAEGPDPAKKPRPSTRTSSGSRPRCAYS